MNTFKQTFKTNSGSFQNLIMSNNSSTPIVGEGATIMHYTDRSCYEVIEVSKDGKTARLERLQAEARVKPSPIGHQDWIFKPTGNFITVTYMRGGWYTIGKEIVFTNEFQNKMTAEGVNFIGQHLRKHNPELADKIWGTEGRPFPQNIVEGVTKEKKRYDKIRILFGVKDYYYDWQF